MTKPKLTRKQIVFVKGIAEGKTGTQAALDAYDTDDPNTAESIASENLRKPAIQQALAPVYEKIGIGLEKSLLPIAKSLEAKTKRRIGEDIIARDDKGRPTEIRDVYEYEDNLPLQLQASDRALKLLGITQRVESDDSIKGYTQAELEKLAGDSDEMTLTQLVFKKNNG